MKRFLSLITVLACLFSIPCAACGESETADVTYRRLYEQILTALDSSDSGDSVSLRAETATVWTENASAAGFLFDGAGWSIRGKADMDTGLITSIICRLPYSRSGLLMAHAVLFTLSGEREPADYLTVYVSDTALLNGTPFPDYENTLDAGTSDTLIFEFIRTAPPVLNHTDEICDMSSLIDLFQKPQ